MNKVTKVQLCTLCEEYDDVCGHDLTYASYRCNLCLFVHSLNSDAQRCCLDLTDKSVLDDSCFAKEKKPPKAEAEIPVNATAGRRDK